MRFWVQGQLVDGGLLPLPPRCVSDAPNGGALAAGGASSANDSPTPDSHAKRAALLDSHAQRTALLNLRRAMTTGKERRDAHAAWHQGAADYDSDATVVIEDESQAQIEQDREKRAATALYWESREFASSRARLIGLHEDSATAEVLTVTPTQKVNCLLAMYGTNRESTENLIARIRQQYAEQQSAAKAKLQAKRQRTSGPAVPHPTATVGCVVS